MAKTSYNTIDQYHATFPDEIVKRMHEIRQIIHHIVPEVEETISYQIPCFKYRGYLLYYSAYTKHISLSSPWSDALLNTFRKELKQYKVSRSAIQLPNDKPLPTELIRSIVVFRKEENEGGCKGNEKV